jgi:chitin deacetylase
MTRTAKTVVIICVTVIALAVIVWGGYTLMRSRTFQLSGELVSRVHTDEKAVALTFDDGPTYRTPEILAALDEMDIPATFFLTGQEIEQNMDMARAIGDAGHQIGNHSYTHQQMILKSRAFIDDEIDRTNDLIRKAGFKGDIRFRPPFCKKLLQLPLALSERNMVSVTWDIEPDSYSDVASSPQRIADYVQDHVSGGSIILLHVMYDSAEAARDALPLIVEQLRADGYTFVTVNALLEME